MQPDKQQASGAGARLVASSASLQELVAIKSSAKLCNQFLLVLVALLVLGQAATSKAHTSSQSLLLFPAIALLTAHILYTLKGPTLYAYKHTEQGGPSGQKEGPTFRVQTELALDLLGT